jgi:CO/xanthine dehydrogenase Mo-binding subunit
MHVQGSAAYIDDMPAPKGTLHVAFALSEVAHGKINKIDISSAKEAEGVHSILLAKDIENLYIGALPEILICIPNICFFIPNHAKNERRMATIKPICKRVLSQMIGSIALS